MTGRCLRPRWKLTSNVSFAPGLPHTSAQGFPQGEPRDLLSVPLPQPACVRSTDSRVVARFGRGPQYVTANIEDLRVGDWVLAHNPKLTDEERYEIEEMAEESGPEDLRTVGLRMTKPDGGRLDVTLLRPVEWLETYSAKLGATVNLDLPELGAEGPAEVVSVEPCPEIVPPPADGCQIITGTFAHESAQVLDLTIEGESAPIGVTSNHPIWSEDRQAFIPAGELRIGETLLTASGAPTRVLGVVPRSAPEPVYNIEVDLEHVYYVSTSGVLVHNAYGKGRKGRQPKLRELARHPNAPSRYEAGLSKR